MRSVQESMKGSAVVIASYPRSGKDWLSQILRYFAEGRAMRCFEASPTGRARPLGNAPCDLALDKDGYTDLDTLLNAWPEINQSASSVLFYKTHHKRVPSFPTGMVFRTVYLVRDPIRVFVSYLNFLAKTRPDLNSKKLDALISSNEISGMLADFVECMGFRQGAPARGSWAENVQFWTAPFRANVIGRYEDRLANPLSEHTAILEALGSSPEPGEVENALAKADSGPQKVRLRNTESYVEGALDPTMVRAFRDRYRSILKPLGYA